MAAMKMFLDFETTWKVIGKKLEPAKEEIYRPTYSLRVDRAKYTMRYNDWSVHYHNGLPVLSEAYEDTLTCFGTRSDFRGVWPDGQGKGSQIRTGKVLLGVL